jgi:cell division protein FtsL
VAVAQETQYALSRMAKMVMAAFAAVVVLMFSLICVNTQLIQRKTAELNALETQRAELVNEYTELQNRIAEAKSETTIRAYVQSQGTN